MTAQRFTLAILESVRTGPARFTLTEARPGRAILFLERSEVDSFGQDRHYHAPRSVVFLGQFVPSACHRPCPCEVRLVAVDVEAGTATFEAEILDGVPIIVHDDGYRRSDQSAPAPQPSENSATDFMKTGELTAN